MAHVSRIVLIGIGQELRGDDAAGIEIVRAWQQAYPDTAKQMRVELSPLPGLGLLDLLEDAQAAILVDAIQSGAEPGTVHTVGLENVEAFAAGSGSAHGFGVAETLALAKKISPASLPEQIILLGIEIQHMDLGQPLSSAVQASIPQAVLTLEKTIQNLRKR
jgi:hydrogenase maturation protease